MSLRLLIGIAVLFCQAAFAEDTPDFNNTWPLGDGQVRVNGFATLGVSWLKQQDARVFSEITSDPNFKWANKLGLQASYTQGQFGATVLGVIKGKQYIDTDKKISRAYLSWQPDDQVTLRAGRLAMPQRLGSAYRDVGNAYPWPMSQVEMYGIADTTEGVDALIRIPVSDWNLQLQPYWLRYRDNERKAAWSSIDRAAGLAVKLALADDIVLFANSLHWKIRTNARQQLQPLGIGYFTTFTYGTAYQQAYASLKALGISDAEAARQSALIAQQTVAANAGLIDSTVSSILAEPFFDDRNSLKIWSLGFSYEKNNWLAIGEILSSRYRKGCCGGTDWNLTLGRFFGDFLPYLEVGRAWSGKPGQLWSPQNPANQIFQKDINDLFLSARELGVRLYALGFSYGIKPGWDFKAEWRRTEPRSQAFFALTRDRSDYFRRPFDQFTITLNHVF